MNLPNRLTIARIVLVPFYLAAMVIEFPYHYIAALIIFIVASITDFLDGKIARKTNQITVFGKLCDPLADKMLTTAALLAFMDAGVCNIWIPMIILTREFLVTSFRLIATSQGVIIPAGILGKMKTATQMVFSIAIMAGLYYHSIHENLIGNFSVACNVLLGITGVLAVISGIKYIVDGVKVVDITK